MPSRGRANPLETQKPLDPCISTGESSGSARPTGVLTMAANGEDRRPRRSVGLSQVLKAWKQVHKVMSPRSSFVAEKAGGSPGRNQARLSLGSCGGNHMYPTDFQASLPLCKLKVPSVPIALRRGLGVPPTSRRARFRLMADGGYFWQWGRAGVLCASQQRVSPEASGESRMLLHQLQSQMS